MNVALVTILRGDIGAGRGGAIRGLRIHVIEEIEASGRCLLACTQEGASRNDDEEIAIATPSDAPIGASGDDDHEKADDWAECIVEARARSHGSPAPQQSAGFGEMRLPVVAR